VDVAKRGDERCRIKRDSIIFVDERTVESRSHARSRRESTLPGSVASLGSDLISGASAASGSTPGSDVSLGSRLIAGTTFASGLSRKGGGIARAEAARASRQSLHWLRRLPCSQMLVPPHSLHWLRCLPCSQMLEPPHSLHWLRTLPCSQMLEPPHSLHLLRTLPCSQMLEPPHSLHWLRCLPCSQRPDPPHSLHLLRSLPCSQIPFPGHSLQKYPPCPFPCGHNGPCGPFASPERVRLPRLFGMSSCVRAERCARRAERREHRRAERFIFLGPDDARPERPFFSRPRVSPTHAPARRCDSLGRALPRCGVVAAPW